jgi:hypothetical protein
MVGTAGTASRIAAAADEDLDCEIEIITRALEERGLLERDELERLVGAGYCGPGRFRAALLCGCATGCHRPPRRPSPATAPLRRRGSAYCRS